MTLLLLTYDQSLPGYDSNSFRIALIELFLSKEIDCELDSPVSSTFYIETQKQNPLIYWNRHLRLTFDSDYFFFSLAEIRRDYSSDPYDYKLRDNPDDEISGNFYDLVEETRERLS